MEFVGLIAVAHDCISLALITGRCELCKTKFRFDPQYAENAPDHLPAHEVFLGLTSRFLAKWLPLAIRIFIAASLWLVVAPLLTACLYHGWMHRPASIIPRMKREIIPSDIVSGAIVAAIIIISFLSLMSFADFLRVHWQEPPRRDEGNDEQAGRNNVANGFGVDDNTNHDYGDIDEAIVWAVEQHQPPSQEEESEQRPQDTKAGLDGTCFRPSDYDNGQENLNRNILETQAVRGRELAMTREARQQDALEATNQEQNNAGEPHLDEGTMGEIAGVLPFEDQGIQDEDASSDDSDGLRPQLNADDDDLLNNRDNDLLGGIDENELVDLFEDNINNHAGEPLLPPPGNEERGERPFDPMDPVLQDDQVVGKNLHLGRPPFYLFLLTSMCCSPGHGNQRGFGRIARAQGSHKYACS